MSWFFVFRIIGWIFIGCGLFLTATSMLGFTRFSDIYSRIHIATINDMLGVPLAIIGTAFMFLSVHDTFTFIKLLFAVVIWYITAPITSYIIIKITHFYKSDEDLERIKIGE